MTDNTETVSASVPVAHNHRPNRLYQTAAWVAIVAGVVFIVGAVLFTGFALGRHSGYDGPRHRSGECSMMQRGPGMGPGMTGPGMTAETNRPGPGTPPRP